jgi:HEPN domain-containing protein
MPPELRDEVLGWLSKARTDLLGAETLAGLPQPLGAIVCFLCQQCAEKQLKAFLVFRQTTFRKSHDLAYVLELCAALEPEFAALRGACKKLTPYAWKFRYPGLAADPAPEAAHEALDQAQLVARFVASRLPAEFREGEGG